MAYALERMGARVLPREELAATIGPPLRDAFGQFLQTDNPSEIERAVALYRERYADVGLFECHVYEGIAALIHELSARKVRVMLATSKPHVYATRILEHFKLAHYFTAIHGSELDGRNDRKSDLIAHILSTHRLHPGETVMVGDRGVDITGARANGVDGIGVLWGFGSRAELEGVGAVAAIERPAEMLGLFDARGWLKGQ